MHLRIRKKTGLFFLLRPYLRRRGLWAGFLLFVPLLLWSQGLVWAVDASGLTTGQQARAASVLRETVSLMPGSIVTQEKLAAGEYALLQSGEFSWVSLNFLDGRLILEAAEAKPVPEIAAGTLHGLRAKTAGTVVSTNLVSGTMLVVPGQAVEKGQGLIGTARAERDGTLIFQPAAGSVRAQFEWEFAEELPLTAATYQLTGNTVVQRRLFLAGRMFPLPSLFSPADDSTAVTRHLQPELLGLTLPLSVEETTYYEQAENEVHSSEDETSALAGSMIRPGVTTHEIDTAVRRFIESHGAKPSFLGYGGFPGSACISINEEVIHGIPGPRKLKEGDIVSVDVGAFIGGFHGDCAGTYPCGQVSDEALRLIRATQQSFFEGIRYAREGYRLSDISAAVQAYAESQGYSIVREYVGHGIGRNMHEAPEVPNYGRPGHGPRLLRGMTIAVEPMVNAGSAAIVQMPDGWTVRTADGKYAAHYENTVLITAGDPELLTDPEGSLV